MILLKPLSLSSGFRIHALWALSLGLFGFSACSPLSTSSDTSSAGDLTTSEILMSTMVRSLRTSLESSGEFTSDEITSLFEQTEIALDASLSTDGASSRVGRRIQDRRSYSVLDVANTDLSQPTEAAGVVFSAVITAAEVVLTVDAEVDSRFATVVGLAVDSFTSSASTLASTLQLPFEANQLAESLSGILGQQIANIPESARGEVMAEYLDKWIIAASTHLNLQDAALESAIEEAGAALFEGALSAQTSGASQGALDIISDAAVMEGLTTGCLRAKLTVGRAGTETVAIEACAKFLRAGVATVTASEGISSSVRDSFIGNWSTSLGGLSASPAFGSVNAGQFISGTLQEMSDAFQTMGVSEPILSQFGTALGGFSLTLPPPTTGVVSGGGGNGGSTPSSGLRVTFNLTLPASAAGLSVGVILTNHPDFKSNPFGAPDANKVLL
jgi:hypothetical protein